MIPQAVSEDTLSKAHTKLIPPKSLHYITLQTETAEAVQTPTILHSYPAKIFMLNSPPLA